MDAAEMTSKLRLRALAARLTLFTSAATPTTSAGFVIRPSSRCLPSGLSCGQIAANQRFVDHRHQGRVGVIAVGELPPLPQSDAQRPEIRRTDHLDGQ